MKKSFILSMFMTVFCPSLLFADAGTVQVGAAAPVKKGPNVTIESDDLEKFDLNKKTDPEQKPELYVDENTKIGFNDDAQPSVGMRF